MGLAIVLNRHFLFRIAQVRLADDAGTQFYGHVHHGFRQARVLQRQAQPRFGCGVRPDPCPIKCHPGLSDSGGSFVPVQHVGEIIPGRVRLQSPLEPGPRHTK
ncbi:hypothetical protein AS031_13090 [Pseudarthrobacter enclensis]|uniref:Uncharacterized protein n=1 Tax=Pseudarthrobacter enclensis TaxID=993070 RepID=A0A0V8IL71_9MICC|nr:hypothetical protein AS031_13090 [Pseudarthrobacter enclensis]